jgi:hypothetical protein
MDVADTQAMLVERSPFSCTHIDSGNILKPKSRLLKPIQNGLT